MSSGAPPAAIAIIRISGDSADFALERLAGRLPKPRTATLVSLRHQGELLDRALALRFPGPSSATGEDLVELHLHGGRSVVAGLLGALATLPGLRPAEPGEFTRRAFEHGRIDLSEAEGLSDLLSAETSDQRRAALALAGGALSRQVADWQDRLLGAAARVEALLDFSDEEDVDAQVELSDLKMLAVDLRSWLERPSLERLKDGVRIVIAGPPNAGKSSLLNALAGREAAITSPIPGTTRDLVEAPVLLSGMASLLIDTAGLRDSEDMVESIGIDRAQRSIESADLVLWLGEPDRSPDGPPVLKVQSKIDQEPRREDVHVWVSAVSGEGLDHLVGMIADRIREMIPGETETAINARHRLLLADCLEHVEQALSSTDLLIAAESLRLARSALDRITGRAGVEAMLDALFGRFCIGK